PFHGKTVTVTHPAGLDTDPHLALRRLRHLALNQFKRTATLRHLYRPHLSHRPPLDRLSAQIGDGGEDATGDDVLLDPGEPQFDLVEPGRISRREVQPDTIKRRAMGKMRAVQVAQGGGALELVEREMPEPTQGEVRVRVEACGVCHSDSLTVEGQWPGLSFPRIPGHEIAGIIDAVGTGVVGWSVGQRVGVRLVWRALRTLRA